ncbi:hypothetical protein Cfor_06695 [Coptotermes formosanus]|uniref:Uncharacterized protein n=1 Tax=Coptotermes formosanus TaxID=36987 RepID=A0A6L2QBY9_COPFO|nr:hypothetical protein Cfor_06695 [Coptotermes formosanus]
MKDLIELHLKQNLKHSKKQNEPGVRLPNTNLFYNLQNYDTSRNSLVSAQKQQQQSTNNNENSSAVQGEMQGTGVYIQAEGRKNSAAHALENDRFLAGNGKQYEPSRRKGTSSYEIPSFGFHRGREGVRNGDITAHRRRGCSGMTHGAGEFKANTEAREGVNCDDRVSPSDYAEFKIQTRSSTSPNPLQESHNMPSSQVENYPVSDNLEVTAPNGKKFRGINSTTISKSVPQRTGRNGNYSTDLVPYGFNGSRQTDERRDSLEGLNHEGRSSGTSQISRNGRQAVAGSNETREGEVIQYAEPNAVAEPRQGDAVSSYYDFLINEGSYKFWAAFQVITAILLIYSAFAAIYYAKYTFSMMDYPDYLDEGFFFKRSGEAYVTTTTARPSSYSFLGLSSQTFQRIMNALSSKKYS